MVKLSFQGWEVTNTGVVTHVLEHYLQLQRPTSDHLQVLFHYNTVGTEEAMYLMVHQVVVKVRAEHLFLSDILKRMTSISHQPHDSVAVVSLNSDPWLYKQKASQACTDTDFPAKWNHSVAGCNYKCVNGNARVCITTTLILNRVRNLWALVQGRWEVQVRVRVWLTVLECLLVVLSNEAHLLNLLFK